MDIDLDKIAFNAVHHSKRELRIVCEANTNAPRDKHSQACRAHALCIVDAVHDFRHVVMRQLNDAASRARAGAYGSVKNQRGERMALNHRTIAAIADMFAAMGD